MNPKMTCALNTWSKLPCVSCHCIRTSVVVVDQCAPFNRLSLIRKRGSQLRQFNIFLQNATARFVMAEEISYPAVSIRSSSGVEVWSSGGLKAPFKPNEFVKDQCKTCRAVAFSPDGRFFAYANGLTVNIANTSDWKISCSLPRPKAFYIKFSPRGTYILTWELFMVSAAQEVKEGQPNLFIYAATTGKEVFSAIQKKQIDWEPCWATDESLLGMMCGGEAFFYDISADGNFQKSPNKIGGIRNGVLSIGPSTGSPFLSVYTPGANNSPAMCKIYKYPAIQANQALASKSIFQVDRVEMLWNKRGSGLLLLTSTEVDKTGASYYGKQTLNYMSTKGDSYVVQLGKEGPIHSVAWNPKSTEFCVVYGYMPAKATIFNQKCDAVFDFAENSRNCCYFNDIGNLLILAGFGNLRGYVEIWDMNKRIMVSSLQAPDSTYLEWCPNGEVFLTATTAPRLRIGNGFKVWHYSGALLHETLWPQGEELLEIIWQKYPDGAFTEKPISTEKIEGITSSQPEASKQVYQPPNMRQQKDGVSDGNLPNYLQQSTTIPGLPPGFTSSQKKTSKSNQYRKKRPSKADITQTAFDKPDAKTEKNANLLGARSSVDNENIAQYRKYPQRHRASRDDGDKNSSGDPEKDKKIRNLNKKLHDISKLKSKQSNGEHLEANQLTKIASEALIVEELRNLKINTN